jgi:hypothetical protein
VDARHGWTILKLILNIKTFPHHFPVAGKWSAMLARRAEIA